LLSVGKYHSMRRTHAADRQVPTPLAHYDMRSWWAKTQSGATGASGAFGDGSMTTTVADAIAVVNGAAAKYDLDRKRQADPLGASAADHAPTTGFSMESAVDKHMAWVDEKHARCTADHARRCAFWRGHGGSFQTPALRNRSHIADSVAALHAALHATVGDDGGDDDAVAVPKGCGRKYISTSRSAALFR
jgi:hypothetical protein